MATTQPLTAVGGRASRSWNIRDWRLGPKMLAAFLSITLIPLALTGLVALGVSRDSLLQQGRVTLTAIGKKTALEIDQYLSERRQDMTSLGLLPDLVALASSPDKLTAQTLGLKALTASATRSDYDSVVVMGPDGAIILSSDGQEIGTKPPLEPYFTEAMKGSVYLSDPSVSPVTNRPTMHLSAPIRDATGVIVGIVRGRLNLNGIWQIVERDKDEAGPGTVGILLDSNGIRIAHSSSSGNRESFERLLLFHPVAPLPDATAKEIVAASRYGAETKDRIKPLALPEVSRAMASPQSLTSFESTADNSPVRHQALLAPIVNKPWYYVIMAPVPTFTAPADRLGLYFLAIALVVALFASVAAILLSRTITRPIVQLTQIAERISLGELDVRMEIHRKDEIGELADAVGRMQASLQAAIERLRARRSNG